MSMALITLDAEYKGNIYLTIQQYLDPPMFRLVNIAVI